VKGWTEGEIGPEWSKILSVPVCHSPYSHSEEAKKCQPEADHGESEPGASHDEFA